MAFLESQIEARRAGTENAYQHAVESLLIGVTGDDSFREVTAMEQAQNAIEMILAYYGVALPRKRRSAKASKGSEHIAAIIDRNIASTGVMYREVFLSDHWYKDAVGCLLGLMIDGTPVALVPAKSGGYVFHNPTTRKTTRVTQEMMDSVLRREAYCFYRPFPNEKITLLGLLRFMRRSLETRDVVMVVLAACVVALIGMFIPLLNQFIFGPVVEAGEVGLMLPIGAMLLSITLAQMLIYRTQAIVSQKIGVKITVSVQAAVMMRALSLPVSFYKDKTSGGLASNFSSVATLVSRLQSIILGAGLTSVFSLVYIVVLFSFSPIMVIPAFISILLSVVANLLIARYSAKRMARLLQNSTDLGSLEYSLVSAIEKIKLAGAEKRVFSMWAEVYAKYASLSYGRPGIILLATPITVAVNAIGLILIYAFAIGGGITNVADYMAFASAYGMVSSAFAVFNTSLVDAFSIKPLFRQVADILSEVPEVSIRKAPVGRLLGSISIQNIRFSFSDDEKPLFDGLSLNIKAGQHVAIVGKTGCGKSTLLRLMLGFETPSTGGVFFDGRDIAWLDLDELRSNIGVVLQNSSLISGSIFQNIAVARPSMTIDEAWVVAEKAGLADDIRAMPMGMATVVGEGGRGLSGGQRQRVMIARALAGNPKVLIFDEATSALDNITQRHVAQSLDGLKCTRVVIAHRLSTVKNCDVIFVLDEGRIIEQGSYEELIEANGFFADLVSRQQA